MSKSKAMYGISRIDDDLYRTHAWRVSLRRQGKLHVKNFPDKKYGGKRKAQQAAKLYRDDIIRDNPPTTRKQFCATVRRNNTSGIPGVYTYGKRYALKDGSIRETRYWEAHWPVGENGSAKASFSYNTFGEEKAKALAIQARQAGIARLKGVFWASKRGELENASQASTLAKAKPKASRNKQTAAVTKAAAKKASAKKASAKKAVKPNVTVAKVAANKARSAQKAAPKKAKAAKTGTTPTKRSAVQKTAPKKAAAKKAVAKKTAVKKAPTKAAATKKATNAAPRKAPAKQPPAKTAVAKKGAAKKASSAKSRKA